MLQMQEKNMGHICPIGRSGVKETDIHNELRRVYSWLKLNKLQ